MDKKKEPKDLLIMPKLHSKFNNAEVEQALLEKSRELLGKETES